ncbi:MAG: hypothetical protein RBR49_12480, partial [Desulfovibrio desulfuricans]|nr:hypothetical protein [Desulfovibrio desulfuricans]
MSHFLQAKRMLGNTTVSAFVQEALSRAFKDGYSLQDPHNRPTEGYGVEIFINQLHYSPENKERLFEAAMNVLRIPFCRPCGLTFQVDTRFRVEAREFKQMLHQLSGIAPE